MDSAEPIFNPKPLIKWFEKYKTLIYAFGTVLFIIFIFIEFKHIVLLLDKYIFQVLKDINDSVPNSKPSKITPQIKDPYFYVSIESLATFFGSIIALITLIALLRDSQERTKYEKGNLEINTREQRAFLRPVTIQYYYYVDKPKKNNSMIVLENEFDKITPDIRGKKDALDLPIAANKFIRIVYDINTGSLLLAVENVGKGMASNVTISISSNNTFPDTQTVKESTTDIPPGEWVVLIKDLRYDIKGIVFNDSCNLYVKVSFKSYFTKEPKEIVYKGFIKPYPAKANKLNSFYLSEFIVEEVSEDGNGLT